MALPKRDSKGRFVKASHKATHKRKSTHRRKK